MSPQEKLKLLKSVRLFKKIPETELQALGEFLKAQSFEDGAEVFAEGSQGESLYFVTKGQVRISKKMAKGQTKDLAVLPTGACFGEMALIDDIPRSAAVNAVGETTLLELARSGMNEWLRAHPQLAVDFFSELIKVQSQRLRRTSNELTLLFDLSSLLLEPIETGKELLGRVLERVVPHLSGEWVAGAYLYNIYNEEMDFVASSGSFDPKPFEDKLPSVTETKCIWIDPQTFYVSLPGAKRPFGYLLLRTATQFSEDERAEHSRTLTTVAQLLSSALENIEFRMEETLRNRLHTRTHGSAF